jgi:hypothetical protein
VGPTGELSSVASQLGQAGKFQSEDKHVVFCLQKRRNKENNFLEILIKKLICFAIVKVFYFLCLENSRENKKHI